MPNLLSKTNAKKLAYRLKTYWASKGYLVETSVENSDVGWVVRSDMLNGMPQRKLGGKH